jgi:peptide/nickel transport system substrate-binding protein
MMRRNPRRSLLNRHRITPRYTMAAVFLLVMVACTNSSAPKTKRTPSATVQRGGVYRTAVESFPFTDAFDPTGEYFTTAAALHGQLLLRNLVTYNHIAGLAGDILVPDLATDTGEISSDGLTWTFHLKQGIEFGPPVNREVTSRDIEYAFRRIDTKSLVAQYGFYYDGTVVGMNGPDTTMPAHIRGIDTPDDKTIAFHLQAPAGDFGYRLAMAAAAPVPEEIAKCFMNAGDYGRDLVSSGPYMILGADRVDITTCDTIKPMSGFDPTAKLIMVRNPRYDPSTDTRAARENNVDGISIIVDANTDDIFNKIQAGQLDGSLTSIPPPTVEQRYLADPTLKNRYHANSADGTGYITMNLLVPPFDDIHVRKATSYVIDKASIQRLLGGPAHGAVATHIFPPTVLDFGANVPYDPYPSANYGGDVNAAKNEMRLSQYDHDGDGVCDDEACKNVIVMSRTDLPGSLIAAPIIQDLAQIGIEVKLRELDASGAYGAIDGVKNLIPIAIFPGWAKDYPDPYTFAVLFHSSGINCEAQINYSEVGMTEAQARQCGVLREWRAIGGNTLSVDTKIGQCEAFVAEERTSCWVSLDKYLMEEVVPWVPRVWNNAPQLMGSTVTKYEYDQSAASLSLCHIAVSNGISAGTLS